MKLFIRLLSLFLILNTFYISRVEAQSTRDENKRWLNGFNLTNLLIPSNEIKHGGPPRDGIPAINQPKYAKADATDFLHDDDYVLGVYQNDIAKAYPIRILNYHEIVNDLFDETAIAITYCPLCGSGVAILADIDGTRFSFGVSGLLYNSDVLLYDRETESLWSQLMGKAVSGSQS